MKVCSTSSSHEFVLLTLTNARGGTLGSSQPFDRLSLPSGAMNVEGAHREVEVAVRAIRSAGDGANDPDVPRTVGGRDRSDFVRPLENRFEFAPRAR